MRVISFLDRFFQLNIFGASLVKSSLYMTDLNRTHLRWVFLASLFHCKVILSLQTAKSVLLFLEGVDGGLGIDCLKIPGENWDRKRETFILTATHCIGFPTACARSWALGGQILKQHPPLIKANREQEDGMRVMSVYARVGAGRPPDR